jgi:4-amino-4-deoxy-L-arabinose transferase-like glycosyltransferase
MKKLRLISIVLMLLGVSLFTRIWRVTEAPASVNWDEAALGYNAYSLLMTGRDEFGKALPVALRSFDDYKPAGYAYLAVLPIKFFGLSEFSTRLPSVVYGSLLVFLIVYITAKLSRRVSLGLVAGLFLSISPWAMHFSRIAFEANVAMVWYFLGVALFVLGCKSKKYLWLALIVFGISMYFYHAQRMIAIPTFVILVRLFTKDIKIHMLIALAILLAPMGISFITEPAGSRLLATNIFKLWPFVPKEFNFWIFSPWYTLIWQVTGQFLAYFSPVNIFVRGSLEPILKIPSLGLLPVEMLPLWILGLVKMWRYKKMMRVVIPILVLAPLPGLITWNWFSVVRTLALYPMFAIVAAVGCVTLTDRFNKLKLILGVVVGVASLYSFLTIAIYAPLERFGDFQPGFETMVPFVMDKSKNYQEVIVDSGQAAPYIFFLFYGKYPPKQYLAEANRSLKHSENYGYKFGKFTFRKIEDYELYKKDILLVGQTNKLPEYEIQNVKRTRDIRYTDFYDLAGYVSMRVVEL